MVTSLYIPLFIGMLPLPGSSTFNDLEEKLGKLYRKLLIRKGEVKYAVKLNFMANLNQECF